MGKITLNILRRFSGVRYGLPQWGMGRGGGGGERGVKATLIDSLA